MKKLYKKGSVHPTQQPLVSPDQLAFLPATILTLSAALSHEDRQVLAYLLSCPSANFSITKTTTQPHKKSTATSGGADHPPSFNCYCFNCYMGYWGMWDSSPNRQIIDEIIEAYEDGLQSKKKKKRKGEKRKGNKGSGELRKPDVSVSVSDSVAEIASDSGGGGGGTVRRFLSFLGERIWSLWT